MRIVVFFDESRFPSFDKFGGSGCARRYACRRFFLVILAVFFPLTITSGCHCEPPFPPLYPDKEFFLSAIERSKAKAVHEKISGITVPHHLLVVDSIADVFKTVGKQQYHRVIILSPDHYSRGKTLFSVATRDFKTALGNLKADLNGARILLKHSLAGESNLFSHEHAVQGILPFISHFFPEALILAVSIGNHAKKADLDSFEQELQKCIDSKTLIVQSTDFSHFLPWETAKIRDQETLRVLAGYNPESILGLSQPFNVDSKGAFYLQQSLQRNVFNAFPRVLDNRNSQEFAPKIISRTTSYICVLYSYQNISINNPLTWVFGGDTFLGRFMEKKLSNRLFSEKILKRISQILPSRNLFLNLEGVILEALPRKVLPFQLGMKAAVTLDFLKKIGVKGVSLANNHSLDFGERSKNQMKILLKKNGIFPLDHGEMRDFGPFRMICLSDLDNNRKESRDLIREHDFRELQKSPRDKPLFAFVHWGREWTNRAGKREIEIFRKLELLGTEFVIGCHSHCPGTLECAATNCRVYSLGNFLFDQTREGAGGNILEVTFFKQGTYFPRIIYIGNLYKQKMR